MREAMAQAARKAAQASGGRPVPADNLHVTLAFLGSVPDRRLPDLAAVAEEAAEPLGPAFAAADSPAGALELAFDRLEYWRAAKLLCALPAEPPALVTALARRLQKLLVGRGFTPDLKPFRPHVTVVRKVVRSGTTDELRKMQPVIWRFTELALVASRTLPDGALYSVVGSYPLCGGRKSANNSETP